MNEELKKWLEQNPPRVELTELEKGLNPKDFNAKKHVIYTDLVNGVGVYRLRLANDGEINSWPWLLQNMNEGMVRFLKRANDCFGVNFLGYSREDVMTVNSISTNRLTFID